MGYLSKKSSLAMMGAGFDSVAMTLQPAREISRRIIAQFPSIPCNNFRLSGLPLLSGREAAFVGASVSPRNAQTAWPEERFPV